MLSEEVNDTTASLIVAQMLYLEAQDPDKDIQFYINSPGGSVTSGMAIYDTMQYIKPDVSTLCIGMAASMGAFLLSSGTKGKRIALPNSEIMIHQPSGGSQGQCTDIQIQADQILKIKHRLNKILSENTGKTIEEVERTASATILWTLKKRGNTALSTRSFSSAEPTWGTSVPIFSHRVMKHEVNYGQN